MKPDFSVVEQGYNREEVNAFVDKVISNTENLVETIYKKDKEIDKLKLDLIFYQKQEKNMSNALISATDMAYRIKMDALKEKKQIIYEANEQADKRLNEYKDKIDILERNYDEIKKSIINYTRKVEKLLEDEKDLLEEMRRMK